MMILAGRPQAALRTPASWWRRSGKLGAVAAREVSRFGRNSRDWQQLIETGRVVDSVLVDQETIYLPRHGDDRLLVGTQGHAERI